MVTAQAAREMAPRMNARLMMLGPEYGHAACDENRELKKKICEYLLEK